MCRCDIFTSSFSVSHFMTTLRYRTVMSLQTPPLIAVTSSYWNNNQAWKWCWTKNFSNFAKVLRELGQRSSGPRLATAVMLPCVSPAEQISGGKSFPLAAPPKCCRLWECGPRGWRYPQYRHTHTGVVVVHSVVMTTLQLNYRRLWSCKNVSLVSEAPCKRR